MVRPLSLRDFIFKRFRIAINGSAEAPPTRFAIRLLALSFKVDLRFCKLGECHVGVGFFQQCLLQQFRNIGLAQLDRP
jgi:hypothetical protein